MIVFGFCLFIFGICFLIAALSLTVQNKRRKAETTGTITEVRKHRVRKHGTTYSIDFEFLLDGVRQELKKVKWSLSPDVTKKYTICYNPKKAKDAHVKEFRPSTKLYLIIGLASIVVALILVVAGAVA
jgi:hypothetical protein